MTTNPIDVLTALLGALVVLSVAAERLVEIVKGVWPWLNTPKEDPDAEGRRRTVLHLMAVGAGMLTAWLASYSFDPEVAPFLQTDNKTWTVLGLGLLSSGGSSLWNSLLTYVASIKDIKRAEATTVKAPEAQMLSMPSAMPQLGHLDRK